MHIKTHIVSVSGGSGSGKTTVAKRLQKMLENEKCQILSQDSYYRDQSARFHGDGSVNFDHPDAIDFDLLSQHLRDLNSGYSIQVPIYDFVTHTRKSELTTMNPSEVIIVDGTLLLTQEKIRRYFSVSLFLDIEEDTRFSRRLQRDILERGRSSEGVYSQFYSLVKPMHDLFVQPSSHYASHIAIDDDSINASLNAMVSLLRR